MDVSKKVALKANVEMSRPEHGGEDEVYFMVRSPDRSALTGNQILEAIAEVLILYWENNPLEERSFEEFDG